jgi:AcrR family transcriptional regulator
VELTLEHYETGSGLRGAFAYLTPGAVAARAGLSRALIYHHWGDPDGPDADAFARFLASVAGELWSTSVVPDQLAGIAAELPPSLTDVVRAFSDYELERLTGRELPMVRATQALAIHGLTPAERHGEAMDQLATLYTALGVHLGVEPVPPLEWRDVAFAVSNVIEGHVLISNVSPEWTSRRYDWNPVGEQQVPGDGWTLLGITIEAMLSVMLRPVAEELSPG